jgi:hypothetical protein
MSYPVVFAALTALCWGLYGPILAYSRTDLRSPFKPYVAIGLAYLVWGVFGGLIGMAYKHDDFSLASFTGRGGLWGLAAGTLGAWGAFTLTLAMFSGGKPYVVMPIVFGGAVSVSAIYSIMSESADVHVSPLLWVGVVGILVCAILVASNTPHPKPAGAPKTAAPVSAPAPH